MADHYWSRGYGDATQFTLLALVTFVALAASEPADVNTLPEFEEVLQQDTSKTRPIVMSDAQDAVMHEADDGNAIPTSRGALTQTSTTYVDPRHGFRHPGSDKEMSNKERTRKMHKWLNNFWRKEKKQKTDKENKQKTDEKKHKNCIGNVCSPGLNHYGPCCYGYACLRYHTLGKCVE